MDSIINKEIALSSLLNIQKEKKRYVWWFLLKKYYPHKQLFKQIKEKADRFFFLNETKNDITIIISVLNFQNYLKKNHFSFKLSIFLQIFF